MKRRPAFRSAPVALRWLALVALILLAPVLSGAIPSWWVSRGVVASGPPAPGESDFAALNLGQLKTLAFAAYAELAAPGSAGTSTGIEDLLKTWCQTDDLGNILIGATGRPTAKPATNETADFATVNVGQLKTVAKPFYERLIAIGYVDDFPWAATTDPASDFAMANVGQAKTLFSFDVKPDGDSDGMPDWWERRHGLNPNSPATNGDAAKSTIFWGVPNSAAYALGFSRTSAGQARVAPRRPNVPPPPDAPPTPPPSASPTGYLIARTVLTAERRKFLTSATSENYAFPTYLGQPNPSTYAKKEAGLLRSTDPQGTPRYGINGDADLLGKLEEDDDPRDYGYDDHNDDGVDQDFNGDPDETGDILPPAVWSDIDYYEWYAHRTDTENYRIEEHPNPLEDETLEPVRTEHSEIRVWSSDRGNPGRKTEDATYNPLGGGAGSYLADQYMTYGSTAGMGWMGDGPAGRTAKTAEATHTTSTSTLTWYDEFGDPQEFQSNSEDISLEWIQIRVQSNIATGPDEILESPFAIYDDTGCIGVITLITDPGNFFANRFRASSDTLGAMVRTVGGAATINLEPPSQPLLSAPPALGTYTALLMAIPAPTIFVDPTMHGVVGDEVLSILGSAGEKHFVSPKVTAEVPGDYVILQAFGITSEVFNEFYQWSDGVPLGSDPLKRQVPRSSAARTKVTISTQLGGFEVAKFNVWVVWADCQPALVQAPEFYDTTDGVAYSARFPGADDPPVTWKFLFTIQPQSIVVQNNGADIPDLTGEAFEKFPSSGRPGAGDSAARKWDVSRQMRFKVDNQIGIPFPSDPVAGNDDPFSSIPDEETNPYLIMDDAEHLGHAIGQLSSKDAPKLVEKNSPAPQIDQLRSREFVFFEFARLEIRNEKRYTGPFWFRISDFPQGQWHHHLLARWKKPFLILTPRWVNEGSNYGAP